MKKIYILLVLFSIVPGIWVFGQVPKNVQDFGPRRRLRLELGMGFGKNMLVNTLQLTKYRWLDKNKRFSIGAGFRLNNLNFSNLTMNSQGSNLSGYGSFEANGMVVAANFMVAGEFIWENKFGIGMNADLVGFSIGGTNLSETFTVNPGVSGDRGITPYELGATVPDINIRKGFSGKNGFLNSEIFATYKFSRRTTFKLGYSAIVSELTLNQVEDRFSAKSNLVFAGCRFSF